jgi:hypothetical protein
MSRRRTILGVVATLAASAALFGAKLVAQDRATNLAPETQAEALMTLDALIWGASEVALPEEIAVLRSRDLAYAAYVPAEIEARYPVRGELREAVHAWPADLKRDALRFFLSENFYSTVLNAFVLEGFDPPPAFAPTPIARQRAGGSGEDTQLAQLLGRAHAQGKKSDLWKRLRAGWKAAQMTSEQWERVRGATIAYMRWKGASWVSAVDFRVVVNPLMAPRSGANVELGPTSRLLIEGPWETDQLVEMNAAHEFLHGPLFALESRSARLKKAILDSSGAFAPVTENNGYAPWESYLNETLCRCLSYRIAKVPDHETGFIYEAFVSKRLDDWEKSQGDFETFLISLCADFKEGGERLRPRTVASILQEGRAHDPAWTRAELEKLLPNVDAWYHIARISTQSLGDQARAKEGYSKVLEIASSSSDVPQWMIAWSRFNLGAIAEQDGQRDEARALYVKVRAMTYRDEELTRALDAALARLEAK